MGSANTKATAPKFANFYDVMDFIATNYMFTSDFKTMKHLADKSYCNKLIVLTADIIRKNFSNMDIEYLDKRVKDGSQHARVTFVTEKDLQDSQSNDDDTKHAMCIGIAKFYVKIAHIFAAIMTTINPVYTYRDIATGEDIRTTYADKDTIPPGVALTLYKFNICDDRIRALKRGQKTNKDAQTASIQPRVCEFNSLSLNGSNETTATADKTLRDEPGMRELQELYMDEKYDYSTGQFTGMSEKSAAQYRRDVETFYHTFTGETGAMPDNIRSFSDIKLRNYSKTPLCKSADVDNTRYTLPENNPLYVAYAENIQQMIQHASNNQHKLLTIINELFTFSDDAAVDTKQIRVNPQLTADSLQLVVEKARKYIISLYVTCELDYVKGVKLFEAIAESKIVETTKNQLHSLRKESDDILRETRRQSAPLPAPDVEFSLAPLPSPKPAEDVLIKPAINVAPKPAIDVAPKPAEVNELPPKPAELPMKPAEVNELPMKPVVDLAAKPAEVNELPPKPAEVNELPMKPAEVNELPMKPSVDLAAKPAVDLAAKPAVDLAAKPAVDLAAKPAVDLAAKPAVDLAAKPAVDLAAKPVVDLPNPPVNVLPLPPKPTEVNELPKPPVVASNEKVEA